MHFFAVIEKQRVEAEQVTAGPLIEAVGNMISIAAAINNLAAAVRDAAQTIS